MYQAQTQNSRLVDVLTTYSLQQK